MTPTKRRPSWHQAHVQSIGAAEADWAAGNHATSVFDGAVAFSTGLASALIELNGLVQPVWLGNFKVRKAGVSGAEGAKDIPSWAKAKNPLVGENGKQYATRLMDEQFGPGNWKDGAGSDYSKLKKYCDRSFVDPSFAEDVMEYAYLLEHSYEVEGGYDEFKLIGIYSSQDRAEAAVQRLRAQPGFRDRPEAFKINRYKVDEDNWVDGYIPVNEALDYKPE